MDSCKETGSENVDSSSWPHKSKSLSEILTDINQNVQSMLRLIKDGEPLSTDKFLCLYQSLGVTYNDLNQELLNGLLNFDFKLPCSDNKNTASPTVTPMAHLSPFKSDISPSLELDLESVSVKNYPVSPGRKTSSEMAQSSTLKSEFNKNESAFLLADTFRAELETALRDLQAKDRDLESEKRQVLELESKLSDYIHKIESLESELEEYKECLEVSEVEISKLMEMLSEYKTEKAKVQIENGVNLLDSLREELRSREIQIEQMEEYLNQVCLKDTEIMSESDTNNNVMKELKSRVEELENQVEMQKNLISEREEEKREAIRELCFSLDHYKSKYIELIRSLSDKNKR